jgi:hypothetical protein
VLTLYHTKRENIMTEEQNWLTTTNAWLSSTPPKEYFDKGFKSTYIPIENMLDMLDTQLTPLGYSIRVNTIGSHYVDTANKKTGALDTSNVGTVSVTVTIHNPFGGRDIVRDGVGGSASPGADSHFPACYSNAVTNALEKFKVFGRGMKTLKENPKAISNVKFALNDLASTWSIEQIAMAQQKHAALGANPDFIAACTARLHTINSLAPDKQEILLNGTKEEVIEAGKTLVDFHEEGRVLFIAKYKTFK